MNEAHSPLLIAIADKLASHQLIRQSDYHDTIALLKEVRAVNTHAALVEALKAVQRLDYLQEHNAIAKQVAEALRQAEEGK